MAETVQEIHARMLRNTGDSFDKSNGSFIFDAEKAGAIEFSRQQKKIEGIQRKQNITNLTGDELTLAVYERTGIRRREATKSKAHVIISGSQGATISIGDYVATDTVNFIVLEEKTIDETGSMIVLVECEFAGRIGNIPPNSINRFPTTLTGLINVYNPEAINNGYDAETDAELLERYFERLQNPGKSGNPAHYKEWAKETVGVGDAKVFPKFNGPLTMQVVIINQDRLPAAAELVNEVYEHIARSMPFGVDELSILSADSLLINLQVSLSIKEGLVEAAVIEQLKNNITELYFKELAFKSDVVSYAKIGSIIIDTEGVLDYQNLLVNGGTANIPIPERSIAVMGGVNE
ncbi:MAG: baseplate J/gp47 family protein [Solibacillus sp.]|uniref:baseplate J/gp47 family protein n=1 Tax=Solibacillus sp. TaxID=1909654 RepID=UPI00331627F1